MASQANHYHFRSFQFTNYSVVATENNNLAEVLYIIAYVGSREMF